MEYVTPKEACKFYKVTYSTLRRWEKKGQIKAIRTNGGHRRYRLPKTLKKLTKIKKITKIIKKESSSMLAFPQNTKNPILKTKK